MAQQPLQFLRGKDGLPSPELMAVLGVVVFLTLLPSIVLFCKRNGGLEEDLEEEGERSTAKSGWWASAMQVDFGPLPSVSLLISIAEEHPAEVQSRSHSGTRQHTPIGPYSSVTEGDVRYRYDSRAGDAALADKVVLVLKLGLGMYACGHMSVDVEQFMVDVAAALDMPTPSISVGHRVVQASFGRYEAHVLRCGRDLVFSGLADLTALANAIANGECRTAAQGLFVCDELLERPLPYGWLVQLLAFEGIVVMGVIVAYHGSFYDVLGAAICTPFLLLSMHLGRVLRVSHLEIMVVSFAMGVMGPLVFHYVSNGGQAICHIGYQFIAPLIIHLPGCQIIWGALELAQGSVVHGGTRIVNGMFQAMLMATFVSLGWQIFGRHWALGDESVLAKPGVQAEGPLTSLPPSVWCPEPWLAPAAGVPSWVTWYTVGVLSLPMLVFINVNLNIRPRESLGPLLCGVVGAYASLFLAYGMPIEATLPSYLQNIIVTFITASAANGVEFATGLSSVVCVVPFFFLIAPGSAAMMACIGAFHRDAGEMSYSSIHPLAAKCARPEPYDIHYPACS